MLRVLVHSLIIRVRSDLQIFHIYLLNNSVPATILTKILLPFFSLVSLGSFKSTLYSFNDFRRNQCWVSHSSELSIIIYDISWSFLYCYCIIIIIDYNFQSKIQDGMKIIEQNTIVSCACMRNASSCKLIVLEYLYCPVGNNMQTFIMGRCQKYSLR